MRRECIFKGQIVKNWHIGPGISECIAPIFAKFSGLVGMWVRMINLTFVLGLPKGHCHSNQLIFGVNGEN